MKSNNVETPDQLYYKIARNQLLELHEDADVIEGLKSMGASEETATSVVKKINEIRYGSLPSKVFKRSGADTEFDATRISSAAFRALQETQECSDATAMASLIARHVVYSLQEDEVLEPCVEGIQDRVERTMISLDLPETARAFIRYRDTHAESRLVQSDPELKVLTDENRKFFDSALGEFVYYRSYSRWLPDLKRRETWPETVKRYMTYMHKYVGDKISDVTFARIEESILRQETMPSMRLFWAAGPAADATHTTAYNCTYIAPTKWEHFGEIMYLSMCGSGVGFSVESHVVQQLPIINFQVPPTHFPKSEPHTYVVEDSKEGWCDALVRGLRTWSEGSDIKFDYSRLRPAGARLRTMGGRSSGPGPLRALLEHARSIMFSRQGRRLRNLDVHDLICKIGDVVVAGGVRRTALISLSDLDDETLRDAKQGMFFYQHPERQRANNSAVYVTEDPGLALLEEWLALAKSGSGERGIANRYGMLKSMPQRRIAGFAPWKTTCGINPCITADTWIQTLDGPRTVGTLEGRSFWAITNKESYYSSGGFWYTGKKPILKIQTQHGFSTKVTTNHKILMADGTWKEAGKLTINDEISLADNRSHYRNWPGRGSFGEGWLLGNLLGDGNITHKNRSANLDYWVPQEHDVIVSVRRLLSEFVPHDRYTEHRNEVHNRTRFSSKGLAQIAMSYGMVHGHKTVTDEIETASAVFCKGFLRGWFDADGSVNGNPEKGVSIRLGSIDIDALLRAQRMLARFGVISKLYRERKKAGKKLMPNGRGGESLYDCKDYHELVISKDNIYEFVNHIGFSSGDKRTKLNDLVKAYQKGFYKEPFTSKIIDIKSGGTCEVFDCTVEDVHAFDANGINTHNCGEIVLRSQQMCNLSEIVARPHDTTSSLLEKAEMATIIGVYQSMLTDFKYLNEQWKHNCEEERLLGVSITGYWDCPAVRNDDTLQKLREKCRETAAFYAEKFGVNMSVATTCVKPSGSVSQLVNSSSGLHPRFAQYYYRRVRIAASDPLLALMKDQGFPVVPELGQSESSANTYVLTFPVKAPDGSAVARDMPALDQLETWKRLKVNYTEHNPSATITVRDNEWIEVLNWLKKNWEVVGGLSFLPHSNHVYDLAPFEEITREEYDRAVQQLPTVDYSRLSLFEKDDETTGHQEPACESGVCEL